MKLEKTRQIGIASLPSREEMARMVRTARGNETQMSVAIRAGVHPQAIRLAERANSKMTLERRMKIAAAVGIPPAKFVGG